jgi:chromosome segregation ATPase
MNKKGILGASEAIDNLEENSMKLTAVVSELNLLKEDLNSLKGEVEKAQEINQSSNKELSKFNKTIEKVQDKIAQEIRVRITEGAAEQSSRLKDANEKITAVDAKLENLKREGIKTTETAKEVLSAIKQSDEKFTSFQKNSYRLLIVILAVVAYLAAEKFGFI